MTDATLNLSKPFWNIDNVAVDALLDGPPRLEIDIAAAEDADGATIAVAVGYGIGPDLEELYSGGPMSAVVVVAVNLSTGEVFERGIVSVHALPTSVMLPEMPPDAPETDEGGENVAAERVGFDLAAYCGVPRDGARYALFAWLDRLVSETVIVEMPNGAVGAAARASALPSSIPVWHPAMQADQSVIEQQDGRLLLTGKVAERGPFCVLALDGVTREITATADRVDAPVTITADLTEFDASREPSPYPSWVVLFDGISAQTPFRIPGRADDAAPNL